MIESKYVLIKTNENILGLSIFNDFFCIISLKNIKIYVDRWHAFWTVRAFIIVNKSLIGFLLFFSHNNDKDLVIFALRMVIFKIKHSNLLQVQNCLKFQ